MSKGKRYSNEGKLNYKKVFAVIMAIVVMIMFVIIIKKSLTEETNGQSIKLIDYYSLYKDNAWGIIDSNGKIVIEPMYQEMLIVIDNSKDVFLCTYDVDIKTGEYKTKVINRKNEEIYQGYDKVEALENYDENGNAWYEENILRVEKDGQYGLINIDGKEILGIDYDSIETIKGVKNSLIIEKQGVKGLINNSGVTIIEPQYKKITTYGEDYKKGYLTIDENGKYGLVSYTGAKVLDNKYEKINKIPGENYFVIEENNKQKVINVEGEVVISKGYDKIKQIATSGIVFVKDSKYGLMDYNGDIKIKAEYKELKEINKDIFIAKKDKKYGIIDIDSNEKVDFKFTDIYYNDEAGIYIAEGSNYNSSILDSEFNVKITGILSELDTLQGYMKLKIEDEYKYYNFKFEERNPSDIYTEKTLFLSKKDGKYGFVNKDGNLVVDYIYDDATEQNKYGYSAIKKDGLWGSIDSNGNVVIEPTYKLDKNLIIDFIGRWHLGQDINMNYYCEK